MEFDETYFLDSHKEERNIDREPRHRGGSATQRGISSEQIAVLVARDRSGHTMDAILFKSNQDTIAEVMLPVVIVALEMYCAASSSQTVSSGGVGGNGARVGQPVCQ